MDTNHIPHNLNDIRDKELENIISGIVSPEIKDKTENFIQQEEIKNKNCDFRQAVNKIDFTKH